MPNPLTFSPSFHPEEKQTYILAAGRLDSWYVKGFDLLIEAWGKAIKCLDEEKRNKWYLYIAGQGSNSTIEFLKKRCQYSSVSDSIVFGGYQSDMKQLYNRASIYVLSSRSEGFPMVLIEAMSQGCACVATDFKGRTREILRDDNDGIICLPDDVDGLCKGLISLIQHEDLRKNLQNNAYIRSFDFSSDKIVCRWESMISDIII
jgi:glycosyltransferase involved in cell wall biosynthesis